MKATPTAIKDVLILEPKVFGDERGFFLESFNQKVFNELVGHDVTFVQDNQSRSSQGILRGMHFQRAPHSQGKLVRVSHGAVFDVAVDVRKGSPTFGTWVGVELNAANHKQLWIPEGLAHGFLTLSDYADFQYKTTKYYAPNSDVALRWDDPAIGIAWPKLSGMEPTLSARDAAAPTFAQALAA